MRNNNITMKYNFEIKAYQIYLGEILYITVYSWCDAIKEFRWVQRKIDKEID